MSVGFNNFFGVHFIDAASGWVVGAAGTIIKTADGGQTWTKQEAEFDELRSVFAFNAQIAWIAGDQGAIYATKDGGTTWVRQISPTTEKLNGILFSNENEGWAAGEKASAIWQESKTIPAM